MAVELSIRGISSTSNRTTWTWSAWVKRATLSSTGFLFSGNNERTGGGNYTSISFSSDRLRFYNYYSGSAQDDLQTNALYRDTNGWYHIVVAYDSTQATESNRVKLYVNGEQITSFNTTNYPAQNDGAFVNVSGNDHYIGTQTNSLSEAFSGCMSHIHFTDGTAYDATAFGETDSTTGEWKIKTSPSVTYGTNGFFILKDGNSVTDQSGNSNNFTVQQGTLTNTEDCPSNVFATLNPLYNSAGDFSFANGNTNYSESQNQWKTTFSTLGASSGKYYAEFKAKGNYYMIGVADYNVTKSGTADRNFASTTVISDEGYGYYNGNGDIYYKGTSTTHGASYGNGDIVQVALDCDNNRVFFGKNGTWQNSADPTTASTGFAMTATNATYVFAVAVQNNNLDCNFGNGYFGTTAVASAGTNASGIGIFEYDVPTGYTALSTKGLNL
jgi:hypothetical protein